MSSCLLSKLLRVNTFNHVVSKQAAASCSTCKESSNASLASWLSGNQTGAQKPESPWILAAIPGGYMGADHTYPHGLAPGNGGVGRGLALKDFQNKVQALPPYSSYHQH